MEIRIKSVYKSKTLQHQLPPTQGRGQASFQSPVIGAVVPPTPVSSATAPPPASAAATSSSSNLASFQDTAAAETSAKEDETLKMLQRHYLQAILTLAPPHKLSVSR